MEPPEGISLGLTICYMLVGCADSSCGFVARCTACMLCAQCAWPAGAVPPVRTPAGVLQPPTSLQAGPGTARACSVLCRRLGTTFTGERVCALAASFVGRVPLIAFHADLYSSNLSCGDDKTPPTCRLTLPCQLTVCCPCVPGLLLLLPLLLSLCVPSPHRQDSNDVFEISAVAKPGASATTDCLASFAQVQDGAWWLPLTDNVTAVTTSSAADLADCASRCSAASNCMFVTYDYGTSLCSVRVSETPRFVG